MTLHKHESSYLQKSLAPPHFFFLTLAAQLTLASSTDSTSLLASSSSSFFFVLKRLLIRQTFYVYGSRLILLLSPSFLPPCSPAARRFKVFFPTVNVGNDDFLCALILNRPLWANLTIHTLHLHLNQAAMHASSQSYDIKQTGKQQQVRKQLIFTVRF